MVNVLRNHPTILTPTKIDITEDDGSTKELYAFSDNHAFLYQKKDIIEYLEKAIEFYNRDDVAEWIEQENKETTLRLYSSYSFKADFTKNENGKYTIPNAVLKYKEFRPDLKRAWSCKCNWCNKKISSKTDKGYYTLDLPHIQDLDHDAFERSCNEDCGKLIWKEIFKNWIHKRDYQDMFEF